MFLCTDEAIQQLNYEYRGKDRPTDVLSFAALEDSTDENTQLGLDRSDSLGDLIISLPAIKRQSKIYAVTFNQELLRVATHGLLHLLGHDHEKVSRVIASRMRRLERRLVEECTPTLPPTLLAKRTGTNN